MSKILVMPSNLNDIEELLSLEIDGFIFGIKDFSAFVSSGSIEDIKAIVSKIKEAKKEIFISLNKIIYNEDIPLLKEYLLDIEKMKINGILYEDLSIINLKEELNLKTDLVWNQTHLPTNYYTCNYWYEKHKIKYGYLSSEITLDEIINIKKNTNMKLMVNVYGYLPMSYSSRMLITNYLNYIEKSLTSDYYYIKEPVRNVSYPIYEDSNGTYILSGSVLNALEEMSVLIKEKLNYLVLNGIMFPKNDFKEICKTFIEGKEKDSNELKELSKKVDNITKNPTDKGFLYKETIYKVKNNE
jgi:putative protease